MGYLLHKTAEFSHPGTAAGFLTVYFGVPKSTSVETAELFYSTVRVNGIALVQCYFCYIIDITASHRDSQIQCGWQRHKDAKKPTKASILLGVIIDYLPLQNYFCILLTPIINCTNFSKAIKENTYLILDRASKYEWDISLCVRDQSILIWFWRIKESCHFLKSGVWRNFNTVTLLWIIKSVLVCDIEAKL